MNRITGFAAIVALFVICSAAWGALPQTINYQGYLRNTNGTPVGVATNVTFSLYTSASGESALWTESRSVTPSNGIYSVQMGSVNPLPQNLFVNDSLWLGIKIGADAEMIPREQLIMVPFSFRSGTADSVAAGSQIFQTGGAANTGLILKGADAQTANLQEWQSNLGTPVASVSPSGDLTISGNLKLPATTATTGIIKSGFSNLLHSYGPMNFFAGVGAGNTTMGGSRNTGVGVSALQANTTGGWNAGVGSYALALNTTGISNSALGSHALYNNTTGSGNTAVGNGALNANVTGNYNTAVGSNALWDSTGYGNTAVGTGSLQDNTTGSYNTATGRSALGSNLTGGLNAVYGDAAMFGNTSGSNNTALGYQAGYTSTSANANTTGSNNTFIGYNSGPGTATQLTNATAIGANALVSQSNSLVLGGTGATAVKVGIGIKSPTEVLDVAGNVRINDNTIYLRGNNGDNAHGLGWFNSSAKPFLGTAFNDGPVLFGAGGGALGTWSGSSHLALTWNSSGDVNVTGALSKGSGSFKIDHPLDPRNKYLYHSFVESPDMKNIYDGTVMTDDQGYASVTLPEWFETLNRDFRYQLTIVDEKNDAEFIHAKIVRKVSENSFTIRTSKPKVEVCWQVTGIRKDAYAEKHRIQVEEDKPIGERGRCIHPEACVD